jgi:hypothetical protein
MLERNVGLNWLHRSFTGTFDELKLLRLRLMIIFLAS